MRRKLSLYFIAIAMGFLLSNNHSGKHFKALSTCEMSDIAAGDCCTIEDNINNSLYAAVCNILHIPSACRKIKNCDCDETPPCSDPCPNGGSQDEYSNCQQIGGQILDNVCSEDPNEVCCLEY